MTLTAVTDILFRDVPNPVRLREIVARAFDVPIPLVNLRTVGDLAPVDPASRVQLTRQPEPLPGDFADWYWLSVAADLVEHVDRVMGTVAHDLGIVTATDAEGYFEVQLHLPDGTRHTVEIVEDEDDALWLTPEMREVIDHASWQPPAPTVATTA